jgi:hypothetical protein
VQASNQNGTVSLSTNTTRAALPLLTTFPLDEGATHTSSSITVLEDGTYLVGYSLSFTINSAGTLIVSLAAPTNATDIPGTISRTQLSLTDNVYTPNKMAIVQLNAGETVYLMGRTLANETITIDPSYGVSVFVIRIDDLI